MALSFAFLTVGFANGQVNRSIDGYGNNVLHPEWGAAGVNQLQPGAFGFSDGYSMPAGADRPGARMISNALFMQNTLENDPRAMSAYCWVWGQFIDHDITLVKDHPQEGLTVPIPTGDIWFDPAETGTVSFGMKRSVYDPASGTDPSNPRQFVNAISAYIDGSAVYGDDQYRADWLRAFSGGRLQVSAGNLLPWNTLSGEYNSPVSPYAPEMAMPLPGVTKYFVAGDVRANENPFLTAMHTLFVREHNRLCAELTVLHPGWTDEQLYQHARKLVSGIMQAIVYEEWLPALGMPVEPYSGYRPEVNAGILNAFSAAAYRYGHTTINSVLVRMNNQGAYIPEGDILLRDAFFNPTATYDVGGIEPYLIGMATVVQQDFDCKVVDDLRNFLFGAPGQGGMDLAAINIMRGRERGLPDYNTLRSEFGIPALQGFADLSSDPLMNQTMAMIYGDVGKIDPWVGMLAEDHMPDALFGKTAMTIVHDQFMALRDGDRYYYENDPALTLDEVDMIRGTRLADVIRRNGPVTIIQDEIFKAQSLVGVDPSASEETIGLAVYPNPVHEMLFLRVASRGNQGATIRIADLQGRVVDERPASLSDGNNTLTLTLPFGLASGTYILVVRTDEGQEVTRAFVRADR